MKNVKRPNISKLFLYRYRYYISYVLLGIAFVALLITMPIFAQSGLSEGEIASATGSYYLGKGGILSGDFVNLPYRILQKFSIIIFGLSPYSIKLPSIIIGLCLGLLIILLLNRWFKNNVSLLVSCIVVLSTPFLYLAGSGTPLIMIVFWPTLLLWLGSKIQGERHPRSSYCFAFDIALLLALFTPYMVYFAIFCVLFVLFQPHLRFVVKSLPKPILFLCIIATLLGLAAIGLSVYYHPNTLRDLFFSPTFKLDAFWSNIGLGLSRLFSWHDNPEGVYLLPLVSLPTFALALIGLFSTTKGFFASRNSIATVLLIFGLIITGFNPDAVFFFILPFAILVAHGVKYLIEKWYGLFPENPYARIVALLPLTVLFGVMIISGLMQYYYGYHYNPNVADELSDSLGILRDNLTDETLVVSDDYEFYKILEASTDVWVVTSEEFSKLTEAPPRVASLQQPVENLVEEYHLSRLITSPKRDNSDILYLYTYTEGEE